MLHQNFRHDSKYNKKNLNDVMVNSHKNPVLTSQLYGIYDNQNWPNKSII